MPQIFIIESEELSIQRESSILLGLNILLLKNPLLTKISWAFFCFFNLLLTRLKSLRLLSSKGKEEHQERNSSPNILIKEVMPVFIMLVFMRIEN